MEQDQVHYCQKDHSPAQKLHLEIHSLVSPKPGMWVVSQNHTKETKQ
jgi:hypothetical protein